MGLDREGVGAGVADLAGEVKQVDMFTVEVAQAPEKEGDENGDWVFCLNQSWCFEINSLAASHAV